MLHNTSSIMSFVGYPSLGVVKSNSKYFPPLPFCLGIVFLFLSDCHNGVKDLYFYLKFSFSASFTDRIVVGMEYRYLPRLATCFMDILPVLVNDCNQSSTKKTVEFDDFRVCLFVQVLVGHDGFLCILNSTINVTVTFQGLKG